MEYYVGVLKKYAVFEGRATRSEFWYFVLFNFIISIAIGIVESALLGGSSFLGLIYSLAVLIPGIAVGARRLHDIGKSGWWMLIGLVPLVGWIILIVFYATDSQGGANMYGPDPKENVSAPEAPIPPVTPAV
jgi:uncharacterized membrane protein YhaH (DUF805 family)